MHSNAIKQLHEKIEDIFHIAGELGIDNILYNEKYIEIIMADILGHNINNETQGADAFKEGKWVDYKTANIASPSVKNKKEPKLTFQFHWISKRKIEKFRECIFYCAIRENATILKIYEVPYEMISDKLEEAYELGEVKRQSLGKKKGTDAHYFLPESLLIERGAKIVFQK